MATLADLRVVVSGDAGKVDFSKAVSAADEAESGIMSKFSGIGDKLGSVLKVAGAAAGAGLIAGAVIGIEREAISDKFAAQLNLTEQESAKAGEVAGSLYANAYGGSLEEVNTAVAGVVSELDVALSDTSAVEGLSAKVLDLASAFDLDVNEAVARAGVLLKTGLATDADHAMDLITASMQEIAPSLRDELGEATVEYSKFFADLGFTGEETFALLASADDKFSLDKMGDAVKEFSIRATDMSTSTVGAFKAIGLDADAMSGKLLAGGDTARQAFDQIVTGLLSIEDPTARANASIALFGTPLEDLGVNKIPAFLTQLRDMKGGLGDVAGRAEELGNTLNDNAKTKIETWRRKIEGALAQVINAPGILGTAATAVAGFGSALAPAAPALTGLVLLRERMNLGGVVSKLGGALKSVKGAISGLSFAGITTGLSGITKNAGDAGAAGALSRLKGAAGVLKFVGIVGVVAGVAAGIWKLVTATDGLTLAQRKGMEAARQYKSAQDALRGAHLSVEQAAITVRQSELTLASAQDRLNELTRTGKTSSTGYQEALLAVDQASLDVTRANDDLKVAQDKVNEATGKARTETSELTGAIDKVRSATKTHAAEVSFGAGRLEFFGDKAAGARAEVARTEAYERGEAAIRGIREEAGLAGTTMSESASKARIMKNDIERIPKTHKTTVSIAGVSTVTSGLQAVRSELLQIPDHKTITISYTESGAPISGSGLARGGPVHPGLTYLVGERGPELFEPHTAGRIIPNFAAERMLRQGPGDDDGDVTVNDGSDVLIQVDRMEVRDDLDAELIGSALAARLAVLR